MTCYSLDGLIPVVDPSAYVHPSAVLIGDVIVGPHCYVGPLASLRGGSSSHCRKFECKGAPTKPFGSPQVAAGS